MERYYVYQHRKADTGDIFYVGKGKERRLVCKHNRNPHWLRTVNKHGFICEVIGEFDDESEALSVERKVIAEYRAAGTQLVNLTDGGEGVSGLKHTEATKQTISEIKKKQTVTPEARAKISEANKKRYLDPHERYRCTAHLKGKPSHRRGKTLSQETRQKMSASRTGKQCSAEARKKISEANQGKIRTQEQRSRLAALRRGVPASEETKKKISESITRIWQQRKEMKHALST